MGVGPPPPFEGTVIVVVWCLAALLCVGALSAPLWPVATARPVRWTGLVLAALVQAAFHVAAPPRSALESAGRFVFLWPALAIGVLAAGVWHWRDRGRRAVGIDTTV